MKYWELGGKGNLKENIFMWKNTIYINYRPKTVQGFSIYIYLPEKTKQIASNDY